MTNTTIGRWLFVTLVIIGLAFAATVVSAHENEPTVDDAPPSHGTADDWATWMETQMTDHMGPNAGELMESHMGVSFDEIAQQMADDDHPHSGGFVRQGHC